MGKIKIKIHPNSSKEEIRKLKDDEFEVWIKEKPLDGRANLTLVKLLKKFFKKDVEIKSGFKSRNKIIELK